MRSTAVDTLYQCFINLFALSVRKLCGPELRNKFMKLRSFRNVLFLTKNDSVSDK